MGAVSIDVAPRVVRGLPWLLVATAAATATVEVLNWWYAPEGSYGLAVRTGWALLRTLGWLILIWHVRRARAAARPIGLILAVTTIFAVGRLIVPREGTPPLPGVIGFAVLAGLCVTVVVLLYRHPTVAGHLVRHPARLIATRRGLAWREAAPRHAPTAGWLVTARVAAFTYSPLVLVPCLVGAGELVDRPQYLLAVGFWFVLGLTVSYLVVLTTYFMLRGKVWARRLMVWVTLGVLTLDLPLCWLVLGVDGLIRDGAPLVAAATLNLYGLWRAGHPRPARQPASVEAGAA